MDEIPKNTFVGYLPESAGIALKDFSEDTPVFGLSDGRWAYCDALYALLSKTGPADVYISTWTAASADIQDMENLVQSTLLKSC